jgi:hypothetical protein
MKIQSTNAKGFVKDTETNLVINNNISEYNNYLVQKQRIKNNLHIEKELQAMKRQIHNQQIVINQFKEFMDGKKHV